MANAITERYPALGYPMYRRYWFASFASVGATQLVTLGQGWLIFELSGSAMQLGVLGAAAAVPNILMTLVGGVIADRFDKRLILMVTSALITTLLAILAWLDHAGHVLVWHVLAIAALVSLITGLDWPARVSIFPQLVERDAFMSAVALNSFIWQATRMAMPAIGGLVIAFANDTWPVFAIGSAGFFVMFLVIATLPVHVPRIEHSPAVEQLREGIRYILTTSLFTWLMALTFIGMFFSQSYVQIMPVFVDLLGSDERGYGLILSAGGVGSVIGTLLIGGVQQHAKLGRIMLSAAVASVAGILGFAAASQAGSFLLAIAFVLFAASCASVFMITSMTVMQLKVPDHLRGRVMGIHTIGYSLMPLGGLFLGTLVELLDAGAALVIGSTIYLVSIVVVWVRKREIRNLNGREIEDQES